MFNLFNEGGILFMSILTLLFVVILSLSVYYGTLILKSGQEKAGLYRQGTGYIKSIGILSLVVGVFGQLLGMYQGFSQIQMAGAISQPLLIAGIRISMITTLYGLVIFMVSYVIWLVLDAKLNRL